MIKVLSLYDDRKILELIHHAEKLKFELRHSWLSNGRQESVAEHTWRMSIMALLMHSKLKKKVDMCKVMKIIAVHDLSEAEVGDVPAFMLKKREKQKILEKESMYMLKQKYKDKSTDEIYKLWIEYEENKTLESKFVKALDKLDVRIQHNEAKMKTWNEIEFVRSQYAADEYCAYDPFLKKFNELIKKESKNKIINESKKDFKKIAKQAKMKK